MGRLIVGIFAAMSAIPLAAKPDLADLQRRCARCDPKACQAACTRGDAKSCFVLGQMHEKGRMPGQPPDHAKAAQLYQKACDGQDTHACRRLGSFYESGKDVPTNRAKALLLYKKTCKLQDSRGCGPYFALAMRLVADCKSGDVPACLGLARDVLEHNTCAMCGMEVPGFLNAVHYLERAVALNKGLVHTLSRDGCANGDAWNCYVQGTLEDDISTRIGLYEKSCEGGEQWGCISAASVLRKGDKGVARDVGKAAMYLWAGGNDFTAALWAAEARSDLTSACDAGSAKSCSELGESYEDPPNPDRAKAAALYEKACDGGYAAACFNRAFQHDFGIVERGAQDTADAARLYERACEGGDERGCGMLAMGQRWAAFEHAIEQDRAKAIKAVQAGCDSGDAWSCYCHAFSQVYEEDGAVALDRNTACLLFAETCDAGTVLGCARLKELCHSSDWGWFRVHLKLRKVRNDRPTDAASR